MTDRSVSIQLIAQVQGFVAGIKTAQQSVNTFTTDLEKSAKKQQALREIGNAAGMMGAAAGAGVAVAVLAFANFDKAMSNVEAATHETASNMGLLRQAALDAGQATVFSATEAAGAVEALAKAGVSTADILAGGLDGALNLAAAGNLEVGAAAEFAASAMTQFGLAGTQVEHIADLLAAGAGKAQGEVGDLGAALNQVGLVANQTGLSIEETAGGLAAFASAGLIGSDAGTSFKTMLQSLTPRSAAAGALMDKLSLSAYDAQGNFVGLTAYAGQLRDALQGMSEKQQAATLKTIFGSDAVRAASVLYQQGATGIQEWIDKTNDAGYAADTAALRLDNLAGDFEQLKGALETALIGTGEGANGPLREMVQILTSLINAYNDLPGPVKTGVLAIGALVAVIGLSVFAAARAVTAFASFNTALTTTGIRSAVAGAGVGALNKRMLVASVGITAAVTAAVILAGANNELVASLESLQDALKDTAGFDAQDEAMSDVTERIKGMTTARDDFGASTFGAQNIKNFFTPPWMDNDLEKAEKQLAEAEGAQTSYKESLSELANTMQGGGSTDFTDDIETLTATAEKARPVLQGMGLDLDEILRQRAAGGLASVFGDVKFKIATDALEDFNRIQDSIPGRTKTVTDAVGGLGDKMLTSADSAEELSKALDELLGPELGLSEATDAWTTALRHLSDDLDKNNKSITGNTDAAITNRAAIRDRVTTMTDVLTAEAEAGASSAELSRHLKEQRDALLDAGKAAGISRADLNEYLTTLGLTPKLVKTLIEANTAKAKSEIDRIVDDLNNLDGKTARVYVDAMVSVNQLGQMALDAVNPFSGGGSDGGGSHKSPSVPAPPQSKTTQHRQPTSTGTTDKGTSDRLDRIEKVLRKGIPVAVTNLDGFDRRSHAIANGVVDDDREFAGTAGRMR